MGKELMSSNIDYTDEGNIRFLCDLDFALAEDKSIKPIKALYYKNNGQKFSHWMGEFELNHEVFMGFLSNFKAGALGRDLYINYDHEFTGNGSKAAGWVTGMDVVGKELMLTVDWTPTGRLALENKEYKYFSAEFRMGKCKLSDGKEYENVFTGGALTNRPFMTKAQVNLTDKGEVNMDKEQMVAELKLSHSIDIVQLQEDAARLTEETVKLTSDLKEALIKCEQYEVANKEIAKKAESDKIEVLLSDLIRDGKSSQILNDKIYRNHFLSIGSSVAAELVKDMPVIVKLDQVGSSETSETDANIALDAKIQAYALEKKVDYSTALDAIRKLGKE